MLKNLLYNLTIFIFPKRLVNILGSSKNLKFLRDWFFDRNIILKPDGFITWNNYEFYFYAPLQILNRAKKKGIENSLTRAILSLINNESEVIDIGSNYGFITLVCSMYVSNENGKIYSFECENDIYKNLESSIKKNNFKNIELHNVIIGNKNSDDIRTVDSLIFDQCKNINLIKIDTDGDDLDCLKGCAKIVEKFHPVVVIEINNNLDEIVDYLMAKEYTHFYDQFFKEIKSDTAHLDHIPNLIASRKELYKSKEDFV